MRHSFYHYHHTKNKYNSFPIYSGCTSMADCTRIPETWRKKILLIFSVSHIASILCIPIPNTKIMVSNALINETICLSTISVTINTNIVIKITTAKIYAIIFIPSFCQIFIPNYCKFSLCQSKYSFFLIR